MPERRLIALPAEAAAADGVGFRTNRQPLHGFRCITRFSFPPKACFDLRQYAVDNFTVNIGEAEVAALIAIRQTLVVDAQLMQDRGV